MRSVDAFDFHPFGVFGGPPRAGDVFAALNSRAREINSCAEEEDESLARAPALESSVGDERGEDDVIPVR